MTVFAIRWPMRAARRQAEQPVQAEQHEHAIVMSEAGLFDGYVPPSAALVTDLPPVVQAGPNGCTERVTCRGRAGKDGRCAAHKVRPDVPAQDG